MGDRTFIVQETEIGISHVTIGFNCKTETFYSYISTMLPNGDVEVSPVLENFTGIREAQLEALNLVHF